MHLACCHSEFNYKIPYTTQERKHRKRVHCLPEQQMYSIPKVNPENRDSPKSTRIKEGVRARFNSSTSEVVAGESVWGQPGLQANFRQARATQWDRPLQKQAGWGGVLLYCQHWGGKQRKSRPVSLNTLQATQQDCQRERDVHVCKGSYHNERTENRFQDDWLNISLCSNHDGKFDKADQRI